MNCPKCGYKLEGHTAMEDETITPKDGDISICLNCGAVHQFQGDKLIDVDIKILPEDTQREIEGIAVVRRKVLGT